MPDESNAIPKEVEEACDSLLNLVERQRKEAGLVSDLKHIFNKSYCAKKIASLLLSGKAKHVRMTYRHLEIFVRIRPFWEKKKEAQSKD